VQVLSVLLPASLFVWNGYARRWVGDDGFINLRVVSELLAGNGFVYNAGERTEAVTSPAWVALVWLAGALGARLEDAAWTIGLLLSGLGLVLSGCAALLALSPEQQSKRWFLPFGLLGYACLPPAWDYATSGLENGLGLAFLGASACLVTRARAPGATARAAASAAFLLSFATLIRPDYELLAAPLLASVCLAARGWRRLGLLALGLSAGCAYQIFRMGYFASVVPNTALAKQAFEPRWAQGAHYLWNSVGVYWLLIPFGAWVVALVGQRAPRWEPEAQALPASRSELLTRLLSVPVCLVAGALLHITYIVSMGGDFMHARLLLPGFFALFSAVPVIGLELHAPLLRRCSILLAGAVFYVWCVVCARELRVAAKNEFGIGDERGWYARMAMVDNPTRIEHYAQFDFYREAQKLARSLERHCAKAPGSCGRVFLTRKEDGVLPGHDPISVLALAQDAAAPQVTAVVAYRALGIAAAALGLGINVVDYYGLADPVAARLTVRRSYRPGHDKTFDTAWQAARYATAERSQDYRTAAARHALSCGVLADFSRATREPLSARRFLRNLVIALRMRRVEIPSDPVDAEQTFCDE
jgi:arabinofuranosyltransferase